jgi:ADP-heptose:LPS heptosyltransferase
MNIAVFRPLGLGETLRAVPALRALQAALPEAQVTLIGLPQTRQLAGRLRRYVDAFLEFPGFPGLPGRTPDLRALPEFFDLARAWRFDVALQMQGSGEIANPLTVLLGARRTAGFYRFGRFCPDPRRYVEWHNGEPDVQRMLRLLEHNGVPASGTHLEFPLQEPDHREAASFGLKNYALLHPDARSDPWPAEGHAELGDALALDGLRVALTAEAPGSILTRRIKDMMRQPALDLAGRTTLGGFGALVARARVVVTSNDGVATIAAATRTPCVLLPAGARLQDSLHEVARILACAA